MLVTIEQIKTAVAKWESRLSDMLVVFKEQLANDESCMDGEAMGVFNTLRALKYRADNNDSGKEAQKLYVCLEGFPTDLGVAFYGSLPLKTILNQTQIEDSLSVSFSKGLPLLVPYEVPDYAFLWFAVKKTEPEYGKWDDVALSYNHGVIGGEDNLYQSPVIVGDYKFYITNWQTQYSKTEVLRGLRMSFFNEADI